MWRCVISRRVFVVTILRLEEGVGRKALSAGWLAVRWPWWAFSASKAIADTMLKIKSVAGGNGLRHGNVTGSRSRSHYYHYPFSTTIYTTYLLLPLLLGFNISIESDSSRTEPVELPLLSPSVISQSIALDVGVDSKRSCGVMRLSRAWNLNITMHLRRLSNSGMVCLAHCSWYTPRQNLTKWTPRARGYRLTIMRHWRTHWQRPAILLSAYHRLSRYAD